MNMAKKNISPDDLKGLSYLEINSLLGKIGNYIQFIAEPTDEQIAIAVKQNAYAIRHIHNQTKELVDTAINQQPSAIQFVKNPTEEQLSRCFEKDPSVIQFIGNPTYEQKVSAVSRKGGTIQFISNPDENLINLALQNNLMSLEHVYRLLPTNRIKAIIKRQPKAVKNIIDKLPVEVKKEILTTYGMALRYVKKQTEELCLLALNNNPLAIEFVQVQTPAIKRAVIDSKNTEAISKLNKDDDEINAYMVAKKPETIYSIETPSEEVKQVYNTSVLGTDKTARKEKIALGLSPINGFEYEKKLQTIVSRLDDKHTLFTDVIDNKIPLYRVINYLANIIEPTEAHIATGYLFESGLGMLRDAFRILKNNNVVASVTVGALQNYIKDENGGTYVEDMDLSTAQLLNKYIKSSLLRLYTYEETFYHGKFYLFKGKRASFLIIGSSNVSSSGLRKQRELNTLYIFSESKSVIAKSINWYQTFHNESTELPFLDEERFYNKRQDRAETGSLMSIRAFRNRINVLSDTEQQARLNLWLSKGPSKIYRLQDSFSNSFKGYVAIEYHENNLCVLESFDTGNAFYCFNTGYFETIEKDVQEKNKVQMFQHPLLLKRGYHSKDTFTLMLSINNLF